VEPGRVEAISGREVWQCRESPSPDLAAGNPGIDHVAISENTAAATTMTQRSRPLPTLRSRETPMRGLEGPIPASPQGLWS
jgi:hypothetical protein